MNTKLYRYVSRSKVEMLSQQLPSRLKVDGNFKTNIIVLEAELKTSNVDPASGIYSQLDSVIAALERANLIGTISERNKPFFRARLDMRSALFGDVIFFAGKMSGPETYFCGLGGSPSYLIGYDHYQHSGGSQLPEILNAIRVPLEEVKAMEPKNFRDKQELSGETIALDVQTFAQYILEQPEPSYPYDLFEEGTVEFVAKRLVHGQGHRSHEQVVLGTPLYLCPPR